MTLKVGVKISLLLNPYFTVISSHMVCLTPDPASYPAPVPSECLTEKKQIHYAVHENSKTTLSG